MPTYNYTAYYISPGSRGLHDCTTKEEAINLLLENQKKKGITPIAVIDKATNEIIWHNPDLEKEYCQKYIAEFLK